jgi:hypothetical protein
LETSFLEKHAHTLMKSLVGSLTDLRSELHVVMSGSRVDVADIGGEVHQSVLNIDSCIVPLLEPLSDETVTQIV